ncbi:MAG: hypothetical protein ACKO1X_03915 [Acidimicrobiales bacterium]
MALADVPEVRKDSWLLEIARLVPCNFDNPGPTAAQRLLIESYYASWRSEGAADKLMPRLQQHVDLYMSIIERAKGRGDIRTDVDSYALAMVLAAVPLGLSLMNLAGIPRVDDAAMLPLFEGFRHAAKPAK